MTVRHGVCSTFIHATRQRYSTREFVARKLQSLEFYVCARALRCYEWELVVSLESNWSVVDVVVAFAVGSERLACISACLFDRWIRKITETRHSKMSMEQICAACQSLYIRNDQTHSAQRVGNPRFGPKIKNEKLRQITIRCYENSLKSRIWQNVTSTDHTFLKWFRAR